MRFNGPTWGLRGTRQTNIYRNPKALGIERGGLSLW